MGIKNIIWKEFKLNDNVLELLNEEDMIWISDLNGNITVNINIDPYEYEYKFSFYFIFIRGNFYKSDRYSKKNPVAKTTIWPFTKLFSLLKKRRKECIEEMNRKIKISLVESLPTDLRRNKELGNLLK